jgi:hypothetical protein
MVNLNKLLKRMLDWMNVWLERFYLRVKVIFWGMLVTPNMMWLGYEGAFLVTTMFELLQQRLLPRVNNKTT